MPDVRSIDDLLARIARLERTVSLAEAQRRDDRAKFASLIAEIGSQRAKIDAAIDRDNWLTPKDAADLARRTPERIIQLVQEGKIAGQKVGGRWQIDADSLCRAFGLLGVDPQGISLKVSS